MERVIAQLFQAKVQEMGFTLELIQVELGALVNPIDGDVPVEGPPMFIAGWRW